MGAYNDDILIIHIPKCAGWTIKRYCAQNLQGMLMPDDPASRLPIGHVRLADIERFTGRTPGSFAKILACVRNPYEQQLSQAVFWAIRYLRHQRHVHDVAAWRHVSREVVLENVEQAAFEGPPFAFSPRHINMAGFVTDPRCDFHVWYEQHVEQPTPAAVGRNSYQDYGGLYRYWLDVDGEIPDNVHLLRQESLDRDLPAAIADYVDHELPPVPVLNTSSWSGNCCDYYSPAAFRAVNAKFAWAFETLYEKWTIEVQEPQSPQLVEA